jgi:thiol:disulfide interchange protein DsbD
MLNQVMTLAATNLLIGALFVVLALSVVDLWPIAFFQPRDIGAGSGTLGTVVLGMSAGLLSSACVGPVVVGILLGVAASTTEVTTSTVIAASSKMLLFGMGLGLPFLVLSLFGSALPRGGRWMRYVQFVLAAAIGYFAWLYLVKGLQIMGLSDDQIALTLGGGALVLFAAFNVQDSGKAAHERMRRSAMGLTLAVGVAILFRGIGPPQNAAVPVVASASTAELVEEKHNLTWYLEEESAYRAAALQGKNVFIDFYGNWCTNCKEFEKLTGSDSELNAALSQGVLLKIYDTSPTFAKYRDDPRFQELKVGLPFFVITDPQGSLLYKTTDYLKTDEMALFLEP